MHTKGNNMKIDEVNLIVGIFAAAAAVAGSVTAALLVTALAAGYLLGQMAR